MHLNTLGDDSIKHAIISAIDDTENIKLEDNLINTELTPGCIPNTINLNSTKLTSGVVVSKIDIGELLNFDIDLANVDITKCVEDIDEYHEIMNLTNTNFIKDIPLFGISAQEQPVTDLEYYFITVMRLLGITNLGIGEVKLNNVSNRLVVQTLPTCKCYTGAFGVTIS